MLYHSLEEVSLADIHIAPYTDFWFLCTQGQRAGSAPLQSWIHLFLLKEVLAEKESVCLSPTCLCQLHLLLSIDTLINHHK